VVSPKKLKYYRIEEKSDSKGRLRPQAVYSGGDYILKPPLATDDRRLLVCLTIFSWFCYIGALLPDSQAGRVMYVILPFAVLALPLFWMTEASVALVRGKERLQGDVAERIARRLPPASLFVALLAGGAFLGLVLTAIVSWEGLLAGDIVFAALALVLALAGTAVFGKTRSLRALRVDNM
jgi:hypothetical protein